MAGRCAPISPEQAKAILENLQGRRSLAQLRKELVRRGQVVSMTTLRKWRANNWTRKGGAEKQTWVRDAAKAIEQSGLPDDVIGHLDERLQAASDSELGATNMRALLINSALLMAHAGAALPELMKADARGAAALYGVAAQMARAGVDLMRQSRELAERSMRERLAERSAAGR